VRAGGTQLDDVREPGGGTVKWQGEELVPVQSPSELRGGMTVVVYAADRVRVYILTAPYPEVCIDSPGWPTWSATPASRCRRGWCFACGIRKGCVYRLPEPPAEENPYLEQPVPTKRSVRP
jgi:hypothetical protein